MTDDTVVDFVLDDYDTIDVARWEIYPPGSTRSIGWIDFCGPGHPRSVQLSNESQRKTIHEAREKMIKGNRWKPPERTPEQVNEETAKWICDRIHDWSIKARAVDEEGNKSIIDVPFTHKTAMAMFTHPNKVWLLNAAAEYLIAIENFMPSF